MFKTSDFHFRRSVLGETFDRAGIKAEDFPNPENVKLTAGVIREPILEVIGKKSGQIKPRPEDSSPYKQGFKTWQRQNYS